MSDNPIYQIFVILLRESGSDDKLVTYMHLIMSIIFLSLTVAPNSLVGFQTAHIMTSRPTILAWQLDNKTQTPTTKLFVYVYVQPIMEKTYVIGKNFKKKSYTKLRLLFNLLNKLN